MPTYQPARKGVQFSAAYAEAAGSSPLHRAMLYAYELWHETLAAPIRFVNDKALLLATLEVGAPRDASTQVEFMACVLSADRPTESDTAASPTVSLGRPDVSGILKAAFDGARGSLEPWTLIERLYASDDTSGPAILPVVSYELSANELAGASGKLTAQFDDDSNEGIPRITFRREQYPGLMR